MYFQVILNNGAGTRSSNEVNVRTLDGGKISVSFLQYCLKTSLSLTCLHLTILIIKTRNRSDNLQPLIINF